MHDNATLNARKNGELVAPAPRKRSANAIFGKRQLGKRYFGEAGSAMSHGRLPLESRSHGRADFFRRSLGAIDLDAIAVGQRGRGGRDGFQVDLPDETGA